MKQVILIHGSPTEKSFRDKSFPSPSNSHWIPWIQKQIVLKDELAQALEMPKPYLPDYEEWQNVFMQMNVSNETIVVGHSSGAGFLLKYFCEYPEVYPKKMILVAPWIDTEKIYSDFLDFEIIPDLVNKTELHMFTSLDDEGDAIQESFQILREKFPTAHWHEFTNKGHFCEGDLETKEFRELLEVIVK